VAIENLAGNILLFVPLGLLVPLLYPRLGSLVRTGGLALGSSLLIECIQLATGLGGCDVDDVLLNAVGGLLGWLAYRLLRGLLPAGAADNGRSP